MSEYMSGTLFGSVRNRAWRGRVWATLTGHPRHLLSLSEVEGAGAIRSRRHAGIRSVPISQIRGSESRCNDFDCNFNPLQGHTAGRWQSVVRARQQGKSLPPVELVQVGDVYFVRDGHHRISVAHAMGQRDIDAEVMVWQVTGQLPWQEPAKSLAARSPSDGDVRFGRIHARLRDEGARLQNRLLRGLGSLLVAGGIKLKAGDVSPAGATGV